MRGEGRGSVHVGDIATPALPGDSNHGITGWFTRGNQTVKGDTIETPVWMAFKGNQKRGPRPNGIPQGLRLEKHPFRSQNGSGLGKSIATKPEQSPSKGNQQEVVEAV